MLFSFASFFAAGVALMFIELVCWLFALVV